MRMGKGVRTGLGHGGITCVLQTQFSSFLCVGIPILKLVLSHAHWWVISNGLEINFSIVMSSPGDQHMVNE